MPDRPLRPTLRAPGIVPMRIVARLTSWWPAPLPVDRFERMRACAGAMFGIVLTALVGHVMPGGAGATLWLIAPMGASAVLLFAVPASPLAQPWSILGGNLSAALIGVTCARFIDTPVLACAVAVSAAIGAMFWLRCIHPPSGAVALTAVLGGPALHDLGYGFVVAPVGLNSVLLLACALFFNNATGRRYPAVVRQQPALHGTGDVPPGQRLGVTPADLDTVLARYNQVLDVSRDDLETILLDAELQAHQRRFGATSCADIMSRDVVAVEFGTSLQQAWNLLDRHRLTALPVVGRGKHVIGILTRADFLKHARLDGAGQMERRLRALLRRGGRVHSERPEVVGQIMHRPARVVTQERALVELVPLMSDQGLHSIPVTNADGVLVGMIAQSDLIAALFTANMQASAPVAP